MKCKGVFFDWFNTLVGYENPRENLYQKAFQQHGIELNIRTIYKGIQRGDRYYFSKGAPLNKARTLEELADYYYLYPHFIADEAHLEVPPEIQNAVIKQALSRFSSKMTLFPDSLAVIKELKQRSLVVGVITNADTRVMEAINGTGLNGLLDFVTTSEEANSEKPDAGIFRAALVKARLEPFEAVFVGDQYQNDVVGATGAGMAAVLLDRQDAWPDGSDYIRVKSLNEIAACLE